VVDTESEALTLRDVVIREGPYCQVSSRTSGNSWARQLFGQGLLGACTRVWNLRRLVLANAGTGLRPCSNHLRTTSACTVTSTRGTATSSRTNGSSRSNLGHEESVDRLSRRRSGRHQQWLPTALPPRDGVRTIRALVDGGTTER
jgi:hypothetical protein